MATYRDAGVDLEAADEAVATIGPEVTSTWGPDVVGGFGGFAAGLRLPAGYRSPVLMMSTDGVGTKAEIARQTGRLDGLGFDLVAMCVDDLAAAGARPLALTDYLAVGRIEVATVETLVRSVAAACRRAGVVLLGGETAEHPGVMDPDAFDLAAAALGVVEEGRQIDGSAVAAGDRIIGVASPNLRSNGFSLIRSVLLPRLNLDDPFPGSSRTVAETLLEPSVIYSPAVMTALSTGPVHGMAHITGGGLPGNVRRVLPHQLDAEIDTSAWEPPPVYAAVAETGGVPQEEMFRTFNMGIGFVVIAPPPSIEDLRASLESHGHDTHVIGEVVPGGGTVKLR